MAKVLALRGKSGRPRGTEKFSPIYSGCGSKGSSGRNVSASIRLLVQASSAADGADPLAQFADRRRARAIAACSELVPIALGLGRTFCYSKAEYPIRQEIKTTCKALVHIFQAHDKHTDWFRRLSGGGSRRG
jgi:hypothetical protein